MGWLINHMANHPVVTLLLVCMLCIASVSAELGDPEPIDAPEPVPNPVPSDDPHWYDWCGEHKVLTAVIVVGTIAVIVTGVAAAASAVSASSAAGDVAAAAATFETLPSALFDAAALATARDVAAAAAITAESAVTTALVTDGIAVVTVAGVGAADYAGLVPNELPFDLPFGNATLENPTDAIPSDSDRAVYNQLATGHVPYTLVAGFTAVESVEEEVPGHRLQS